MATIKTKIPRTKVTLGEENQHGHLDQPETDSRLHLVFRHSYLSQHLCLFWQRFLKQTILIMFRGAIRPPVRSVLDAQTEVLAALVMRRRQAIETLPVEKNRLRLAARSIQTNLHAHIA